MNKYEGVEAAGPAAGHPRAERRGAARARFRGIISPLRILLAVAVTLAGLVMTAPAANAAIGACNVTALAQSNQGYIVQLPAWTDGVHGGFDCYMNRNTNRIAPGVSLLQDALKKCYGSGLKVDGVFGDATEGVLIRAQRQEGITADGKYGPQTSRALSWPVYRQNGNKAYLGYCWKR